MGVATTSKSEVAVMQKCAMCGGRFPGPGVEREGKFYCCDRCAHPSRMKAKMLLEFGGPLLGGLAGGFLLGRYLSKRS